jgi:hypothetical protein
LTNIFGGELAAIGEFPYMALIGYTDPRFFKVDHIPMKKVFKNQYI